MMPSGWLMDTIHDRRPPQARSGAMTNEEEDLLITYLVDAGDIDPYGEVLMFSECLCRGQDALVLYGADQDL